MAFKLIVFDIDGTLIPFKKVISRKVSKTIKTLEDQGVKIAFSSGKNISYLKEIAVNIGINRPIIIAENGCVIFDMAENKEVWLTKRTSALNKIRKKLLNKYSELIDEQLNTVEFTFSVTRLPPEEVSSIKDLLNEYRERVHVYEYSGCLDILPMGIDKGAGLVEVKKIYGFKKEDVVAIGNGENDIPMFREAGLALTIGSQISYPNAINFKTPEEVLDFLMKCMK